MSNNTERKQYVDSTARKKWDKEYYEKRAKDRESGIQLEDEDESAKKKIKLENEKPLTMLTARDGDLISNIKLGKSTFTAGTTPKDKLGTFYCEKCDVLLNDSSSWLDHNISKRHLQKSGHSMRVETSTLSAVQRKLLEKKLQKQGILQTPLDTVQKEIELKRKEELEVNDMVKEIDKKIDNGSDNNLLIIEGENDLEKKEEDTKTDEANTDKVVNEDDEEIEEDYSYLGLSDFGSSKKNK